MIKAIIFDLGGVLVDLDLDRCRKAFVEDVGYGRIDELLDAWHQKGFYSDLEEGKISEDEFRHRIIEGVSGKRPVLPEDVDRAMWALLTGIEPYKVDLLKDLSHRYDLYLLSNNNGISMARCRKFFADAGLPMEQVFRKQFLSYQMKMLKPSPEIYMAVIRSIGLPPGEMLFIDDSKSNTDAAAALGMNVLLYSPGTDLNAAVSRRLEGGERC